MAAHLVPGPLSAHVEDQLLLRAGLLHGVHGGLVRALRRDMRTLLLQGQFMVISSCVWVALKIFSYSQVKVRYQRLPDGEEEKDIMIV